MSRQFRASMVGQRRVVQSVLLPLLLASGCEYPAALFAPCDGTEDCPARHYCTGENLCVPGCPSQECGDGPAGERCGRCGRGAYCDLGGICRVVECGNGACDPSESILSCPADCRIVEVAAGLATTCLLYQGGVVRCFGDNSRGQVGDGRNTSVLRPSRVVALPSQAVSLAMGARHACAVLRNGSVWCWGANEEGQLGDGSAEDRHLPVRAQLTEPAMVVALGGGHSCAIGVSTNLYCWGRNTYGQVGSLVGRPYRAPVAVSGLAQIVSVALGEDHSCAITAGRTLFCWGRNHEGQLGIGGGGLQASPVEVSSLQDVTSVAAGPHTCATQGSGALWCWGANLYGGLGDGTTQSHASPVAVPTVTHVWLVSVSNHTCVSQDDGAVRCWGNNLSGQLGDGSTVFGVLSPPIEPVSLPPVAGVVSGGLHTCALLADGTVACWGSNTSGQLGLGHTWDHVTPTLVLSQI